MIIKCIAIEDEPLALDQIESYINKVDFLQLEKKFTNAIEPISYLSGRVGREAYIEKYRPEFAAIQFANATLAEDAKIFCFFLGNRSYYSDREMVFGDFDFEGFVKNTDSAVSIVAEFKKRGITHVLVKYDIFKRWSGQQFNAREKK